MAIGTPVSLGNNTGSTPTLTITTTANAPIGTVIFVAVGYANTTDVITVTDTNGNSYTKDKEMSSGATRALIFRSVALTSQLNSGATITVNNPGGPNIGASAYHVTGLATSPIDVISTGASGSSTTPTDSVTTLNAVDIVFGLTNYNSAPTYTPPGGSWNTLTAATVNDGTIRWSYQIVASTNTYTFNPTLGTSQSWDAFVASYKGAATGGPPELMLLGVGT